MRSPFETVTDSAPVGEQLSLLAQAELEAINTLGDEYALRGFARSLTRQRMTLAARLHGCNPAVLLAWLAPGLQGAGCTLTNGQIATALSITPRAVQQHLAKLEATGEIQRVDYGKGRRRRLIFGVAEGLHDAPKPRSETSPPTKSDFARVRSLASPSQEEERTKRRGGARSQASTDRFCRECHCEPCMCWRGAEPPDGQPARALGGVLANTIKATP